MKNLLLVCASILCLALAAGIAFLCLSLLPGVRQDLQTSENRACATLERTAATLDKTRADLAVSQAAVIGLADQQLSKLSGAVVRTLKTVDGQAQGLTQIRTDLAATLEQSVGTLAATTDVLQQYGKLPSKLGSTLDAATSDLQDIQASLDDLYPDLKAGIETAIVAERSIAEAASAVEKAAPVIADAAARNVPETLSNIKDTSHNVKQLSGWPAKVAKVIRTGACWVPTPLRFIPKLCK